MAITDLTTPLVEEEDVVNGSVDYKGDPVHRSSSGGWRSASFIIVVEMAERCAYYGIYSNLITYLTGPLGQSTATAAENVNIWSGISFLLPLLGAFVADSFLGRYRTVIFASLIYILGLSLLTLSALLTSLDVSAQWLVSLFFFSLYLVAIGQGGHKPCVQTFGADQFDGQHPKESIAKSSFFNWWNFCLSVGAVSSQLILVYIQDNVNWALGFGIPGMLMVAALFVFLLGRRTYRYSNRRNEKYPFMRVLRSASDAQATSSSKATQPRSSVQLKDKESSHRALLEQNGSIEDQKVCNEVEDAKASLLRLAPIWFSSLAVSITIPQSLTFFTKQGATMNRTIFPGFHIPAASLLSFVSASVLFLVPIYDIIFIPMLRSLTGKSTGITMLQRIGTGMFISAISMGIAALVEIKRLQTAREYGLVDHPDVTIPMSVLWLVPQYVLGGVENVFAIIGLQEFFYEEVPKELRSVGISLFYTSLGVGSISSSLLVSIIDRATRYDDNQESWFSNNLNKAHLDYFYLVLGGLSILGFTSHLYFARSYIYRHQRCDNI
ncbi:hypothetical protein Tsubulata_719977 [Turnera subulata]|uniref:Major facilitator superfamily (MFS) profile domain-containing protein n=1 Tax=Turnera subulata TaxID=218843 RepID=A0A9Q0GB64_9ROSI|nr:hypothetical protein Tsubulata_719977 [Turnera subulata]